VKEALVPVERKVQASTAAAAVSGLVLWVIGRYIFRGAGVPDVIASWIYVIVPGVVTFVAGYLAKHTPRPLPVLVPPAPAAQIAQAQAYTDTVYGNPDPPAVAETDEGPQVPSG
jgi:hypothetical protein